ncbi:DUF1648 domain-containing protein [Saccharopolyspora sp. K220]|uniref:DUF1648 domain-containing protein n=1 Tax=Saccharopolyspora soli TaxID=2926618 RepID=UPI001F576929|nr:DUF1648 domain-containing protein [Saccharopolyspora soli]MCI2423799.1 DUF1648 domain-containing protein [Saccharopolyspora soli]
MSGRTRFLATAVLWVVAVTVVLAGGSLVFWDRLPDPIASHWGFSGAPNDSMPLVGFLLVVVLGWLAISIGAVVFGARDWRRRRSRAATGATLAAAGVFFAGLAALTVWANLDIAEWRQARSLNWQVLPMLAAAGFAGRLGWFVGNRGPDDQSEQALESGTELNLKPGERAVWLSSVSSPVLRTVGGLVVLVGAVTLVLHSWQFALAPLLAGLACLATSSARVQVDERGVRTAFGPQRWPVRRIGLARIDSARAETHSALEVGGWGYRMRPGTTAIMLRGGECLVLRLTSGRDFVISVDHAERGAELANALITERSAL